MFVELGCGNGALLRAAAARFDCAVGLDLLKERLRNANAFANPPNIQLVAADMDDGLPFRDSSVSCVECFAVFEYAYDPFFFLDEVRRVLVPDGSLVMQVANVVWLPRRLMLLAGRLPPTGAPNLKQDRTWNGGYLHLYTLHDLRALLTDCGFRMTKVVPSAQTGKGARLWPSLIASDFVVLCQRT